MTEPLIHDPGNEKMIEEVFAFMSIDEKGRNGIVASILPGLGSTPLVTASPRAVEMMKPLAEEIAHRTGKPVGLFRFRRDGQLWQSEAG
ncbi:MAG: hypothetical protein WA728_32860 [Xanthobacteraceae bacterium]